MNDDNCDFGFYVDTPEHMAETVGYWLDFYAKRYFIRFSVVDNATGKAVGTLEGFVDETAVFRLDICSDYEKAEYLTGLLCFARDNFRESFGNEYLMTKAVPEARERRKALEDGGWDYVGEYRGFGDYYRTKTVG